MCEVRLREAGASDCMWYPACNLSPCSVAGRPSHKAVCRLTKPVLLPSGEVHRRAAGSIHPRLDPRSVSRRLIPTLTPVQGRPLFAHLPPDHQPRRQSPPPTRFCNRDSVWRRRRHVPQPDACRPHSMDALPRAACSCPRSDTVQPLCWANACSRHFRALSTMLLFLPVIISFITTLTPLRSVSLPNTNTIIVLPAAGPPQAQHRLLSPMAIFRRFLLPILLLISPSVMGAEYWARTTTSESCDTLCGRGAGACDQAAMYHPTKWTDAYMKALSSAFGCPCSLFTASTWAGGGVPLKTGPPDTCWYPDPTAMASAGSGYTAADVCAAPANGRFCACTACPTDTSPDPTPAVLEVTTCISGASSVPTFCSGFTQTCPAGRVKASNSAALRHCYWL